VHYAALAERVAEQTDSMILPGEERVTTVPDTKCLLTFHVETKDARGREVGSCEFSREVLLDDVCAIASHLLRSRRATDDNENVHGGIQYCLHFNPDGASVSPRVRIPTVRAASLHALEQSASSIPLPYGERDQDGRGMKTFVTRKVFKSLEALAAQSERSGLEEGCFLDGHLLYDRNEKRFARLVTECVPAVGAEQTESSLRINGDSWSHYYRTRSGEGTLLGEGHSHPSALRKRLKASSLIFLSASDRLVHRQFFWQFYQTTFIVSKPERKKMELGIWGWRDGYVVREHEAFIAGKSSYTLIS
jgi:hypothetical protein